MKARVRRLLLVLAAAALLLDGLGRPYRTGAKPTIKER